MGVELVHVAALLAADVALPGVGVAVAALVQEVQGGVGEGDGAERAHERRGQQRRLAVRRRDHAALRRRRAGRLERASQSQHGLPTIYCRIYYCNNMGGYFIPTIIVPTK